MFLTSWLKLKSSPLEGAVESLVVAAVVPGEVAVEVGVDIKAEGAKVADMPGQAEG